MGRDWHSLRDTEILEILDAERRGLSTEEIQSRQIRHGKNVLPRGKEPTLVEIILNQFKSPMIIILIIAGILSTFIGEHIDGIFIGIVMILNTILGTYQEYSAIKSASSIQKLLKIKARVLRDGSKIEVDSEELVPGDIVILESGDKVPADIRLLEGYNLQLDEAFLTGESSGVVKHTGEVREATLLTERHNMCYASSTVQSGRGVGIVIATGINTEIGNIAEKLIETEDAKSPLTIRMERFTRQIMYLVFIFAIVSSFLMMAKGYPRKEVFLLVVAMCISAIPESLPIAQTVVLSIATSKMAKKHVIVKKLSSVESLGSCTVIASDKTGTLTVNQQTAKIIALPDGATLEVTGEGYNNYGQIQLNALSEVQSMQAEHICEMGMLNNEAFLEKQEDEFVYHGDSIDLAFLALGMKRGLDQKHTQEEFEVFSRIPYEPENKFSATFFEKEYRDYVTIKGSAETVLELCGKQRKGKTIEPLDYEEMRQEYLKLASQGYRVIALATGPYNGHRKDQYDKKDIRGLTFMGYIGFIDPIRQTSKAAIKKCHKAGIRVIMITGDHPLTAKFIARELDIIKQDEWVVKGEEIEKAYHHSKDDLIRLVRDYNAFARVSPMQKSIIVETLKEQGEFVAVTGDGVNDAPALKKANIGVAMGSGTDVAKDVSTMIITDDNFLSIVSAVEEGRYAYNNFRKVVYLLISTAFAEMLLFTMAIIFNLPPPFITVQILWINLATNGIQDIAVAFEKGESGVMEDMPRAANERIFNGLLIKETLLSGFSMFLIVFMLWFALNNPLKVPIEQARNYILLLMVLLQNVHAFNCRSEKTSVFKMPLKNNKFIVYAIIGALSLHLMFMNVPFLQDILRTNPVTIQEFTIIALMIVPLLFVMEMFKAAHNKIKNIKESSV